MQSTHFFSWKTEKQFKVKNIAIVYRLCWRWSESCDPRWSARLANCRRSSLRMMRTTTSRIWKSRDCAIGSRWLPFSTTLAICIDQGSKAEGAVLSSTQSGWIHIRGTCCRKWLLPLTTKGTTFWWLDSTVSSASSLRDLHKKRKL